MKSQHLHRFRAILLPFLLLVTSVIDTIAADRPPKTKSELITALNNMQGERFTEGPQLEFILAGLERLTDQDKRDTAVHKALHTLAYWLNLEEFSAEAKQLIFKKIEFQESAESRAMVDSWQLLCDIYLTEGQMDSARWYLQLSEKLWQASGIKEENPYILNSRAIIAERAGNLLEASQWLVIALDILNKQQSGIEVAMVQINLSHVYKQLRIYDKALKLAKEAFNILKDSDTEQLRLMAANHVATTYKLMDSLALAIQWNRSCIDMARATGIEVEMARGYMNLGNAFSRSGQYEEALICFDSSLLISRKMNSGFGVMLYHLNKGSNFIRMKRPQDALKEMNMMAELKSSYDSPQVEAEFHDIMFDIYELLNQPAKALYHYKVKQGIKDSLDHGQATQFLLEWERIIEKERASKEIAELNLAVSKSRFQMIILLASFIILGIITFFWFRDRTIKEREKTRLAEEEQARLSADVDMKNRELASKAVLYASMTESIVEVVRKLKRLSYRINREAEQEITQIVRDLETSIPGEEWKEFETRFTQVHEDFHDKLLRICSDLSPVELKVCSLLRLNMSTKEIALLTNRSQSTIINTRSQIRKKLNMLQEENLTSYLLSL
jgi:tetratricopeptide (TPR) repeat protein